MKDLILLMICILLVSLHADACESITDQIKDLETEIQELQSDLNTCRKEEKEAEEDAKQDPETSAPEEKYGDQEVEDE